METSENVDLALESRRDVLHRVLVLCPVRAAALLELAGLYDLDGVPAALRFVKRLHDSRERALPEDVLQVVEALQVRRRRARRLAAEDEAWKQLNRRAAALGASLTVVLRRAVRWLWGRGAEGDLVAVVQQPRLALANVLPVDLARATVCKPQRHRCVD